MGYFFAFWIILAVAAVFFIVMRQLEAVRTAWQGVATELGLDIASARFGQSRISGSMDEFEVAVEVTGSGDNAHTRYRLDYPPQTSAFQLRRESGGQRILKAFGIEDRQIGDEVFDDAFVISATNPEALKQWLDVGRRGSLLRLLAAHPAMLATERSLQISTKGVESDPQVIVATVRRMQVTARHLVGRATREHVEAAADLRSKGDLLAALQQLNEAVAADPEDVDTQLLRAETALSAGDVAQVERDVTAMEKTMAADPEVHGMRRVLDRGPSSQPPPQTPVPDTSAMFQDIFGESRLSFETDDLFAREYQGQQVRLTGAVRTSRPFEEDLDFGTAPGTKVVVTVAYIESDLYGNTAIDAVIALPASIGRLDRGDEITFTGTLAKVDPMMRNVFVENAALA